MGDVMENKKITKVGLCVVAALVGGINYVSFSDMGDNIDKHVVEPIKTTIKNNRIEAAKEKELEIARENKIREQKKLALENDMQKEIARLKKENEQIRQQEKSHSYTQPINMTYPRPIQSSGDNRAFMTAFGVANADEAVKTIRKVSADESYVILRSTDGQNIYAKLESDIDDEPKGLTPITDKNYDNIIESQSGQKYIYENRCDYLGNVPGNIKIIPDSPSIVSIARQVCSIVPIKTNKVETPVVNEAPKTTVDKNETQKLSYNEMRENLDFSQYDKLTETHNTYLKFIGAKTGDISFHMNNGVVDQAKGSDKEVNKNTLNDYYNSVFITNDGSRYVYNSKCTYVLAKNVKITTRTNGKGATQDFVELNNAVKNDSCAILPLTTN